MRLCNLPLALVLCAGWTVAQTSQPPGGSPQDQTQAGSKSSSKKQIPVVNELPPNDPAPRSDDGESEPAGNDGNVSSSRENIIDLSPPKDDLKEHPNSAAAMSRATADEESDVQEFHPWNPMKALKDVEVGDYYFKRKNYKAALDRYKEALFYKENDAVATFRLAVCQEHMADPSGALGNYNAYLKILPHGPFADDAKDAIERLSTEMPKANSKKETAVKSEPEKP